METIQDFNLQTMGVGLVNLVIALIIIIVGYIVARILGGLTKRLLNRVEVDNRIANRMSDDFDLPVIDIEGVAGSIVFWIIILFAIVAALQRLNLAAVTAAINPQVSMAASIISVSEWPRNFSPCCSSSRRRVMKL